MKTYKLSVAGGSWRYFKAEDRKQAILIAKQIVNGTIWNPLPKGTRVVLRDRKLTKAQVTQENVEFTMRHIANLLKPEGESLLDRYNALPVTSTPAEFLAGIGNWGLTEEEHKLATSLAKRIIGEVK